MFKKNPATISEPLLDEIAQCMQSSDATEPAVIAKLRMQAEKLMLADRAEGHLASSGVAALAWDVEEARRQVTLAMQHDRSPRMLGNAMITFDFLNRPDLGEELARTAVRMAPSDPEVVDSASCLLLSIGRVHDAAAVQRKCMAVCGEYKFQVDPFPIVRAVEAAEVDEEWMAAELALARKVLSRAKLRTRELGIFSGDEPDGGASVVFELKFYGTLETEFQLEDELAEELALTESWDPRRLSVNLGYLAADASATC